MGEREHYRHPKPGDHVIYHDPSGQPHDALVRAVHDGGPGSEHLYQDPLVNLAHASADPSSVDSCGRLLEDVTSISHRLKVDGVHGFYWRWPGEKANDGIGRTA